MAKHTIKANIIIGGSSADVHQITGSLNVSVGITGSLFGTASYAMTASYIPTNYVKILRTDGNMIEINSINSAISMSNYGDLIVIKPGTYNESIVLKDGINLHFEKGAILNSIGVTGSSTITDNGSAVSCSITGYGMFKNLIPSATGNNVIYLNNANTILEMEAYSLEGEGLQPASALRSSTIYINACKYFSLKAETVYNARNVGIWLASNTATASLNIKNLITGNNQPGSGSSTLINYAGILYVDIDNVQINNVGHALSHRAGTCYANINKTWSKGMDPNYSTFLFSQFQGTGAQILYLNFDEIIGISGSQPCGGIELTQGSSYIEGNYISTQGLSCMSYAGSSHIEHYNKVKKIISSGSQAVSMDNSNGIVVLEADLIKAMNAMVVWSTNSHNGTVKCRIKNAKLDQTTGSSHVIQTSDIVNNDIFILENCLLVGNNTSIYANNSASIRIIGELVTNVPTSSNVTIFTGSGIFSYDPAFF